jgi:hypothetical protein
MCVYLEGVFKWRSSLINKILRFFFQKYHIIVGKKGFDPLRSPTRSQIIMDKRNNKKGLIKGHLSQSFRYIKITISHRVTDITQYNKKAQTHKIYLLLLRCPNHVIIICPIIIVYVFT